MNTQSDKDDKDDKDDILAVYKKPPARKACETVTHNLYDGSWHIHFYQGDNIIYSLRWQSILAFLFKPNLTQITAQSKYSKAAKWGA